jgi:hypothetical protein
MFPIIASIVLATVVSGAFILFGMFGYPGLHWDAALFSTPIIKLADGQGWKFGSYTLSFLTNQSGEYWGHSILYPKIFGQILGLNNYNSILFFSGIFNSLTFIVYWILYLLVTREQRSRLDCFYSIAFGLVGGIAAIQLQGRPEHLAPLTMSIPIFISKFLNTSSFVEISIYLSGGLLFVLSPLTGVVYAMGAVFWMERQYSRHIPVGVAARSLSNQFSYILKKGLIGALTGGGVAILCIETSHGGGAIEWLANTFVGGHSNPHLKNWFQLACDFGFSLTGFNRNMPLYNILVVVVFAVCLGLMLRARSWVFLLVFLGLAIYLCPKVQHYGYMAFVPMLAICMVDERGAWLEALGRGRKWLALATKILASVYVFIFLRILILFFIHLGSGMSLPDAKSALATLTKDRDAKRERIGFLWLHNPSFVVLSPLPEFLLAVEPSLIEKGEDGFLAKYEKQSGQIVRYVVVPELGHLASAPDKIGKGDQEFSLVFDSWVHQKAELFGLKVGGILPGYQFALYERVGNAGAE